MIGHALYSNSAKNCRKGSYQTSSPTCKNGGWLHGTIDDYVIMASSHETQSPMERVILPKDVPSWQAAAERCSILASNHETHKHQWNGWSCRKMCHLDRLLLKDAPSWLAVMKHTNTNGTGDPAERCAILTVCCWNFFLVVPSANTIM